MSIGIYFHPKDMTHAQYDAVMDRLEEAGAGAPAGREYHACFGEDGSLMVFDVYDTAESFEAFGATLMPILGELGVDVGEPHVMPIHNIVTGV